MAKETKTPAFALLQYVDTGKLNRLMKDVALAVGEPMAMSIGDTLGCTTYIDDFGTPLFSEVLQSMFSHSFSFFSNKTEMVIRHGAYCLPHTACSLRDRQYVFKGISREYICLLIKLSILF